MKNVACGRRLDCADRRGGGAICPHTKLLQGAGVVPPPYTWSGFYLGINGGGGLGRSTGTPSEASTSAAGYSAARSATTIKSTASCSASKASRLERHPRIYPAAQPATLALDRARAPRLRRRSFMPYITGGGAFGNSTLRRRASPAAARPTPAGHSAQDLSLPSPATGPPKQNISKSPWTFQLRRRLRCATDNVSFNTNLIRGGINFGSELRSNALNRSVAKTPRHRVGVFCCPRLD